MISDDEKNKLIEEIKKTYLISNACSKTGISRSTYYRWMKEDLDFRAAVLRAKDEGADLMNDAAESVLVHGIKNKERKSAEYFLSHNHPKYMPKNFHDRYVQEQRKKFSDKALSILEAMGVLDVWRKISGNRAFPTEEDIRKLRAQEDPNDPNNFPEDQQTSS